MFRLVVHRVLMYFFPPRTHPSPCPLICVLVIIVSSDGSRRHSRHWKPQQRRRRHEHEQWGQRRPVSSGGLYRRWDTGAVGLHEGQANGGEASAAHECRCGPPGCYGTGSVTACVETISDLVISSMLNQFLRPCSFSRIQRTRCAHFSDLIIYFVCRSSKQRPS